jgi:hypothetical protein
VKHPNGVIRSLEETDPRRNLNSKISWHCLLRMVPRDTSLRDNSSGKGKRGRLKLNNNRNFNHFLFHADFHWTGIYFLNLGQS